MKYYLGIDGGGTRTTAAVSDENGNILLKKSGKTINFYAVGMQAARNNLESLISDVCTELKIDMFSAAFIGCSALDGEADDEVLQSLCHGIKAEKIAMNSDVYIALKSLGNTVCPCVAICGTGSMAIGEDEQGNTVIAGGWGHIIGDEGSGYAIAVRALKHCCALSDKDEVSPLLTAANRYFNISDFRKSIDIIYSTDTSKDKLAGFAADVGKLALTDTAAQNIITDEAHSFAETVITLLKKIEHCSVLGLYGGIFQNNILFSETFRQDISRVYPQLTTELLTVPPEESALKLARELK